MTEPEMRAEIDNMSYHQLLEQWRFAPTGSPWFQGDIGKYYAKVMAEKRKEVGGVAAVAASKAIG